MGKTKEFLDTLSDHELAYFAKYKSHTYMRDTQQDIKEYIQKRNLTQKAIDQYINKAKQLDYNSQKCCPRCGSDKLLVNNVVWTENYRRHKYDRSLILYGDIYGGIDICKDEIICNVCDFWLEDPNNKKPGKKRKRTWLIWDFFMSAFD